jgi:hypothetical protein
MRWRALNLTRRVWLKHLSVRKGSEGKEGNGRKMIMGWKKKKIQKKTKKTMIRRRMRTGGYGLTLRRWKGGGRG